MGKKSKKPRGKMNPRQHADTPNQQKKEDKDWGFDEIARSKTKRR